MSLHTAHGVLAAAILTTTMLAPAAASAQDPESFDRIDLTIGLKGGVSGSWITEEVPEPSTFEQNGTSYQVDPDLFPLFGLGGAVGLSLDARYAGIVGIETGFSLSFDNGEGWTDKNASNGTTIARIYQEQETTSLRIPVLLKLSTGTGTVRPVFGVGVEFVNQIDSRMKYRSDNRAGDGTAAAAQLTARNQIVATNYMVAKGVLGMELNFDMVRIPIEISGMYNPSFENSFASRVESVEGSNPDFVFNYKGGYQGHFGISVGVLFNYGVLFDE